MRITQIPLIDRLMLVGAPGIGKTEHIKFLAMSRARKLGRKFVDIRRANPELRRRIIAEPKKYFLYLRVVAPHIFPEDIQFPIKHRGGSRDYIHFLAPEDLYLFTLDGIAGLIFLDEITNVTREDQLAMYYSFVLEKELGWNLKLSDDVYVVAAGNPPEYSYIVNPPPAAFISRFVVINVAPPLPEEWRRYMDRRYGAFWDRRVYLYLKLFPDDILARPDEIKSFENFPCPRSWSELAVILHQEHIADEIRLEVIEGKIGSRVGSKFFAFINKRVLDPKTLFSNPKKILGLDLEEKYLSLWACTQQEDFIEKSEKLLRFLAEHDKEGLILLLLISPRNLRLDLIKRYPNIFVEVASVLEEELEIG